jgi:3-deoxy-D-manno-octulosonate 8-phosphate phosphatase (KDO 8-P phosphatase)
MAHSKKIPHKLQKKLKGIKLLILDVDGVLTDGHLMWIKPQGWTRRYHVLDGYGIKLLMSLGIPVAVMSGGESEELKARMDVLKIPYVFLGNEDKESSLEKLLAETGLKDTQCAYIADELFDIPVLKRVGFSASPPHAVRAVQKAVDYVTKTEGGRGAVREVIDMIRRAQKLGPGLD